MEPAAIVLTVYVLLAFVLSLWACFRGTGDLFTAGAVVWCFWCLGVAVQLIAQLTGKDCSPPVWLYLSLDTAALLWFASRRDWWARAFAATFAVQIGLEVWGLVAAVDPWLWWYAHSGSAFAQLAVLGAWIIAERASPPS